MDKITQSITLDLVEISHNVVNARQGDRLTRDLIITITNNGKDYEIPESSYVYIRGKRADGESVFYSATIEDTSIVHVNIHDFLLSYSGRCKLDIGIYNRVQSESGNDSDEIASTEPFILYVPEEIFNENDIVESDEGSTLSKLINSARDEIQEMNELEEEISNSENNRKVNEATRQTNEQTRQTNEQTRINSENIRNSNENTRKANEVIRESQESDRQTNTATAISNAEAATKKANDAADDLQAKLDSHHFVLTEDKGSANGVAELDENGIIISSQLPSYVDDVIEGYFYNSKFYKESTHTTEITGEAGKIYIDLSTEKTYRWSGSTFVVISETLALGETSSTAYRGDRGKIAYEHSQSAHAPSNAEENQNTFSSVIVGDDVISATSKTAALNLVAGTNVTITPDATNDRITISSDHPSISKSTDSTSATSPSAGDTFTAVDSVTRDENGHVTTINTKTITLPNTSVVVDEALSSTSTNPVQNKVVNSALEEKLSLSGGTMTGVITAKPEMCEDNYSGSLNMNNSNIYGLNSIYTSNASEGADEGIHFYRDSDHVDTLWMANGNMYFVPNRELGTYTNASNSNTVLHSGNYKTYCTPANIGAAASSHTHSAATTSSAGFMSAADKKNLNVIKGEVNGFPIIGGNNNSVNFTSENIGYAGGGVLGGVNNTITGTSSKNAIGSTIIGGINNTAKYHYATIVGGYCCQSSYLQFVTGRHNKNDLGTGVESNWGGTIFTIGNGYLAAGASSAVKSNAFRITDAGHVYAGGTFNANGADYAEFFEWADGNEDNEDRRGYFVTTDGIKIKIASEGDFILGAISANPCIIGNSDEEWLDRYVRDEFNDFVYEYVEDFEIENEKGETITKKGMRRVENEKYDPEQEYIPRSERKEWALVGMRGVLNVRDDGTCKVNGFCKVADGGIATSAEWNEGSYQTPVYRVLDRVTDNIVRVDIK